MRVELELAEKEEFSSLADQMGRWLDNVLGPDYHRYRPGDTWKPAINLYEDPSAYYVVVDLAGVRGETLDLRVENGRLVLRGERPSPRPERAEGVSGPLRVHLMEIDHGPFQRTLELPQTIEADAIEARYRNGLLWVKMPKSDAPPG